MAIRVMRRFKIPPLLLTETGPRKDDGAKVKIVFKAYEALVPCCSGHRALYHMLLGVHGGSLCHYHFVYRFGYLLGERVIVLLLLTRELVNGSLYVWTVAFELSCDGLVRVVWRRWHVKTNRMVVLAGVLCLVYRNNPALNLRHR